ncbi:MAG: nucleotidyltransferase domain-containing protein [Vulcanisaeta sp.]|uniref:nucleotidyltransferase domain-containing protein n=1 Tax=Vulcanisaeta sp. TaxID=2020871 RepID=UPI003D0DB34F
MVVEYFEVRLNEVIDAVRRVLEGFDVVEVAVLFGSALRRGFVRDIDIGVITRKPLTLRELAQMASMMEGVVKVPVDLVPLNEAPPLLGYKALTEGVRIIMRNPGLYYYVLSESLMELQDLEIKMEMIRREDG